MGSVAEIMGQKQGRPLVSARPDDSVLVATQKMNEHSVGALLVMNDEGRLVGIFTERDVLRRVVAVERLPSTVPVSEVMTVEVACCKPETSTDEASSIFRQYRIRHMPVVNDHGEVQGLISIGDLNAYHTNNQAVTIHFMHEYMQGRM